MADHNKPVLTSTYTNFVSELDARFDDLAVWLDPAVTTATNVPTNAVRWNSALSKFQKWSGAAWGDLSTTYNFTAVAATTITASGLTTINNQIVVNEDGAGTKSLSLRSNYAGLGPAVNVTTDHPLLFLTNNTERGRFSSTGLAVTGALSATGTITNTANPGTSQTAFNSTTSGTGFNVVTLNNTGGQLLLGIDGSAGSALGTGTAYGSTLQVPTTLSIHVNGSKKATLDSSGNLGLGVTPSAWGSLYKSISIAATGALSVDTNFGHTQLSTNAYWNSSSLPTYKLSGYATLYLQGGNTGSHVWQTASYGTAGNPITFTQAMTLDASGNLLVGTTNADGKLTVKTESAGTNNVLNALSLWRGTSGTAAAGMGVGAQFTLEDAGGNDINVNNISSIWEDPAIGVRAAALLFYKSAGNARSEAARIDSSGNLGLGVTPSAWATSASTASPYKAIQLGVTASIHGRTGNEMVAIGSNFYVNSSLVNTYIVSGNYATLYQQAAGTHNWYTAPSGTAGNPITFTQAMTLDAGGNLHVPGGGGVATNEAFGTGALVSNTTGYNNTASGVNALRLNTTGYNNTASGVGALYSNTEGYYNTASGVQALYSNTTGINNTAIGYNTGLGITTGSGNTIIGANVTGLAANLTNNIILASGDGVIKAQIDASGVLTLNSAAAITGLDLTGSGTNSRTMRVTNTGGTAHFGIESSAGAQVFTGSTAYSAVIGTSSDTGLHLATNGTVRLSISNTGNVTAPTPTTGDSTTKVATTAFVANTAIGVGQTWQSFTVGSTRLVGTTYTNTTGKPIQVVIQLNQNTDSAVSITLTVGSLVMSGGYGRAGVGDNGYDNCSAIVPPGQTYTATGTVQGWFELR